MNRRAFFSALVGASASSAAKPAAPATVRAQIVGFQCECGMHPYATVAYFTNANAPKGSGVERVEYYECRNPKCRHHGWKFLGPTVELERAPADLVARVDREAEEREREARREKERAELNAHSLNQAIADFDQRAGLAHVSELAFWPAAFAPGSPFLR